MNLKKKYVFSIAFLLSLSSCFLWKDDELEYLKVIDKEAKPSWMKGGKCDAGICSIGISPKGEFGFGFQVKEAELIGRQNIIAKIKSTILVSLREKVTVAGISSISFEKLVDDYVSNFDLLSIKRDGVYVDDNGAVYINMKLREDGLRNVLDVFRNMFVKYLKKHRISEENSKNLLMIVDKLQEELIRK